MGMMDGALPPPVRGLAEASGGHEVSSGLDNSAGQGMRGFPRRDSRGPPIQGHFQVEKEEGINSGSLRDVSLPLSQKRPRERH